MGTAAPSDEEQVNIELCFETSLLLYLRRRRMMKWKKMNTLWRRF
jgi:hypothetical protein